MIPTIEKVKDMKSRYPALDNFILKLEERYRTLCKIIDSSSVSDEIKTKRKNSYYLFLIIVKKLISSENYRTLVLIRDNDIVLNSETYKFPYNEELLYILLNNYELIETKYDADNASICNLSLPHEKVRERTNEN